MLYPAEQKKYFRVPGTYDPEESRLMGLILRPDTWTAAKVYEKHDDDNYDVALPTVYTGFYHKVKNPGLAGATEPSWATTPGGETVDGETGLIFEAVMYNLMPLSENIVSCTVTATNGVTVSSLSHSDSSIQFMIQPLLPVTPPETAPLALDLGVFDVVVFVTKDNGEKSDFTMHFKIGGH